MQNLAPPLDGTEFTKKHRTQYRLQAFASLINVLGTGSKMDVGLVLANIICYLGLDIEGIQRLVEDKG